MVQDNSQTSEGTGHGALGSPNKNDNVPNRAACECLFVTKMIYVYIDVIYH